MRISTVNKGTKIFLRFRNTVVSLLLLVFYLSLPSSSTAAGPMEQVRATVDKVLIIVRNPDLKPEGQKANLRAQLAEAIYPRFDFTEMAKRSLGPHSGRRTAEEQRQFVKIFSELLRNSYVDRIESYSSQSILYTRERQELFFT
jgi:phospholipid transport system substrate-binding protein